MYESAYKIWVTENVKYSQPPNDEAPCSRMALFGLKNRNQTLEELHNDKIHNFAKCKATKAYGGSGDSSKLSQFSALDEVGWSASRICRFTH